MIRTDPTFKTGFQSEIETASLETDAIAAGAPHFETLVALQQRGGLPSVDTALADLVTQQASQFAALTPREQAAIAWVEAVISSGKTQSSDGAYRALRRYFDDAEIAKLTALAGTASARTKLAAAKRD